MAPIASEQAVRNSRWRIAEPPKPGSACRVIDFRGPPLTLGLYSRRRSRTLTGRLEIGPMKLPPAPRWNKKTDDIDSADFLRRAQDQERSLLPPETVFPRTGQIWEAVGNCQVHVRKWIPGLRAPALWQDARLLQGERARVLDIHGPKPLEVRFEPLRYTELQEMIAEGLRYELWLRTARCVLPASGETTGYFNELFRLVEDVV